MLSLRVLQEAVTCLRVEEAGCIFFAVGEGTLARTPSSRGMLFVFDGDCGRKSRMVCATLLEPFDMQKHLDAGFSKKEAEDQVVVYIDGQAWSRAWGWPDTDPEDWESSEPVVCIRKRSAEHLMWVRRHVG